MSPRLLHFNGPPGIGKSTLAALWADRHPGTLNLDMDALHGLVGGWRDEDGRTHDLVRPLGLSMAATHLAGGRDVVMPQLLAKVSELEKFEGVAATNGARFVEVVLLADKHESLDRFRRRTVDSDWDAHNRALVARLGGATFLAELYDRLQDVLAARPDALVVDSAPGAVEETYAAVEQALATA